jgi:predicted transcriptional regulator
MTPFDIITDAEIERVHARANFGSTTKREVVAIGVLNYAFGYTTGSTMLAILVEHGLVRRPRPGSSATTLTSKGKKYLKATFGEHLRDFVKMVQP